jgi:hypothetical protein
LGRDEFNNAFNLVEGVCLALNPQSFDHSSIFQVFLDDFVYVFFIHIGVPDIFRIDNDDRPFIATVKASRAVDAYSFTFAVEPQCFDTFLGVIAHSLRIMIITAQRSCLALVYAEKYMPQVVAHNMFNGMRNDESKIIIPEQRLLLPLLS